VVIVNAKDCFNYKKENEECNKDKNQALAQ